MSDYLSTPATAFEGHNLLKSGPLVEVALAVKMAMDGGSTQPCLVFDDIDGRVIDLDLRGTKADIVERLSQPQPMQAGRYARRPAAVAPIADDIATEPRGRGRPKLGVVAREVTLLPRQWEWLAAQPGGASAILRRLVDEARRNGGSQQQRRAAQDAAYQFMCGIAGDLPEYEEANRALFADDHARFAQCIASWPDDIAAYALRLAFEPNNPVL